MGVTYVHFIEADGPGLCVVLCVTLLNVDESLEID